MPTMLAETQRGWLVRTFLAAAVVGAAGTGAGAEVRSATQTNTYGVGGTTPGTLVAYMRSNPFHGSRGDAVANIRPTYALDVASRQSGGTCRADRVTLDIRFVMTLPRATEPSAMSPGTRTAWDGFVAFTRQHEEAHRRIYVECGDAFVAKAERMTAPTCDGLERSIGQLLENEKRACNRRQVAFDRADYRRILGLSLFKLAAGGSSRASR